MIPFSLPRFNVEALGSLIYMVSLGTLAELGGRHSATLGVGIPTHSPTTPTSQTHSPISSVIWKDFLKGAEKKVALRMARSQTEMTCCTTILEEACATSHFKGPCAEGTIRRGCATSWRWAALVFWMPPSEGVRIAWAAGYQP